MIAFYSIHMNLFFPPEKSGHFKKNKDTSAAVNILQRKCYTM